MYPVGCSWSRLGLGKHNRAPCPKQDVVQCSRVCSGFPLLEVLWLNSGLTMLCVPRTWTHPPDGRSSPNSSYPKVRVSHCLSCIFPSLGILPAWFYSQFNQYRFSHPMSLHSFSRPPFPCFSFSTHLHSSLLSIPLLIPLPLSSAFCLHFP